MLRDGAFDVNRLEANRGRLGASGRSQLGAGDFRFGLVFQLPELF